MWSLTVRKIKIPISVNIFGPGSTLLLLKVWHSTFNPSTESFTTMPIWIRLPNLALQFWFDAIGNLLGSFLTIDVDTSKFAHTTFTHILVQLDTSKNLLADITLKSW